MWVFFDLDLSWISEQKAAAEKEKAEEKARADEAKAREAEEKAKVRLFSSFFVLFLLQYIIISLFVYYKFFTGRHRKSKEGRGSTQEGQGGRS